MAQFCCHIACVTANGSMAASREGVPPSPGGEEGTGGHSGVCEFLTETVDQQRTVRLRGLTPDRNRQSWLATRVFTALDDTMSPGHTLTA